MKATLFSIIYKMVQSVKKSFRLFLLVLSYLPKEFVDLKKKNYWKTSFSIDPSNSGDTIQEAYKDMKNKKIVNLANPTDNEDAANKMLMKK